MGSFGFWDYFTEDFPDTLQAQSVLSSRFREHRGQPGGASWVEAQLRQVLDVRPSVTVSVALGHTHCPRHGPSPALSPRWEPAGVVCVAGRCPRLPLTSVVRETRSRSRWTESVPVVPPHHQSCLGTGPPPNDAVRLRAESPAVALSVPLPGWSPATRRDPVPLAGRRGHGLRPTRMSGVCERF